MASLCTKKYNIMRAFNADGRNERKEKANKAISKGVVLHAVDCERYEQLSADGDTSISLNV